MSNKVWYAAYGSNLLRERFDCYIYGGTPEGSAVTQMGCTDKTPPSRNEPIKILHELYFSGMSRNWENKAVAFIKAVRDDNSLTLGRKYLIKENQFIEILRQENALAPTDSTIEADIDHASAEGELIVSDTLYGRVIYLGESGGFPVFTFTGVKNDADIKVGPPGHAYLKIIIRGLCETYRFDAEEIIGYLEVIEGIRNEISVSEIKRIIEDQLNANGKM